MAEQLPAALRPLGSSRPGPLPPEVRRRERRRRVAEAAVGVFVERGYARATIAHLAAAAAISATSFSQLFEGKEDCLLAAYEQVVGRMREAIAMALENEQPWPGQGEAALHALVAFCAAEPEAALLVLSVIEGAGAKGRAAHLEVLHEAEELLRAGRTRLPDAPTPPPPYEEFAITATMSGLRQAIEGGEALTSPALYDALRTLLLGPYLA